MIRSLCYFLKIKILKKFDWLLHTFFSTFNIPVIQKLRKELNMHAAATTGLETVLAFRSPLGGQGLGGPA